MLNRLRDSYTKSTTGFHYTLTPTNIQQIVGCGFCQVILRRAKNNPCLIGDAGVGKTAIVEGIAQLMVSPQVPTG